MVHECGTRGARDYAVVHEIAEWYTSTSGAQVEVVHEIGARVRVVHEMGAREYIAVHE